jgi:hypothetical protein
MTLECVRTFTPVTPKLTLSTTIRRAWNILNPVRNKDERGAVAFALSLEEMVKEANQTGRPIARVPFMPVNDAQTLKLLNSPVLASFNAALASKQLVAISAILTIHKNGEGEGHDDVTCPVIILGPPSLLPRDRAALAEKAFRTSISFRPAAL